MGRIPKFDTETGVFHKTDRLHGHLSEIIDVEKHS